MDAGPETVKQIHAWPLVAERLGIAVPKGDWVEVASIASCNALRSAGSRTLLLKGHRLAAAAAAAVTR